MSDLTDEEIEATRQYYQNLRVKENKDDIKCKKIQIRKPRTKEK